jgi:hypothetical protein
MWRNGGLAHPLNRTKPAAHPSCVSKARYPPSTFRVDVDRDKTSHSGSVGNSHPLKIAKGGAASVVMLLALEVGPSRHKNATDAFAMVMFSFG